MIQGQYLTVKHNDKSISVIVLHGFDGENERVNYTERFCGESMLTLSKDTSDLNYLTISAIHAIRVASQTEIQLIKPEESE